MKKIAKYGLVLVLALLVFSLSAAAETGVFSWYCKRNDKHLPPDIDKEMRFIEEYNGYYVDKKIVNSKEKAVYLTFDAGYENGNVAKILDILRAENVRGSFFILENLLLKHDDLVLKMVNDGNIVCNHTATHKDVSKLSLEELKSELERVETLYVNKIGREMPKLFRPPEGKFSLESMKNLQSLGYKTVFWSFAYADWDNDNQMSCEKALQKIMDNIHNGAILLLHPTSETNVKILPEVIKRLKAQGYSFKTIDEL